MLYAARGLGTLVGTLWIRVLVRDRHSAMRGALVFAFAGQGALYYLLAQATAFHQACLLYGLSGLLQGMVWVFAGTLLLAGALVDADWAPQAVVALMAPVPALGVALALYVWLAER